MIVSIAIFGERLGAGTVDLSFATLLNKHGLK
jgi:hypothetical protein